MAAGRALRKAGRVLLRAFRSFFPGTRMILSGAPERVLPFNNPPDHPAASTREHAMVDFVCPQCGSIDHIDRDRVCFPHQCPGCDAIVESGCEEGAETPARVRPTSKPVRKAVRVKVVRMDEWGRVRPKPALRVRAAAWVGAWALVVVLGGGLYAYLSWPGQAESSVQATVKPARATSPYVTRDLTEATPEKTSADLTPAAARDIQPGSLTESPDAEATEGATRPQGGDVPDAVTASAGRGALSTASGREPALASRIPSPGSNISLAYPLYGRVPMLARPSWSGREIQELSSTDMLLILDNKPLHRWLHVMEVHSGAEGWVPDNQVRLGGGPE